MKAVFLRHFVRSAYRTATDMRDSDIEILSACSLFAGLEKSRIGEMLGELSPESRSYEKSSVIFSPECFTRSLAVILKGSAEVTRSSGSGTVYMSTLRAGSIFGMAALFYESGEYLTSVTAREKCRILFISRKDIDRLFRIEPNVATNYITILSERIHFLNKRIAEIASPDAKEKLLQFLLLSCECNEQGEIRLPCPLTSLANALSIGRTSLYRAFDALEADGIISRNGKNIIMR